MSRSTAAFLIALMFHLLLILLFLLLGFYSPPVEKVEPPKENRIKVSLKEKPKVAKNAPVKNKTKPKKAELMPKGKQLKKIQNKPFIKHKPKPPVKPQKPVTKIETKKPVPKKPKVAPLPPEKPYIPVKKKPVAKVEPVKEKTVTKVDENKTKPPKKESSGLYSLLSKKVTKAPAKESTKRTQKQKNKLISNIKDAYGETFGELSPGEQKYILDNQEIMRRITQQVLNRVGRINIPREFRANSSNIVEFYLYPNGDISEIKFVAKSNFYILDDTTKETIEYAYSKYPRPKQKTRIRYKVGYYMGGQ